MNSQNQIPDQMPVNGEILLLKSNPETVNEIKQSVTPDCLVIYRQIGSSRTVKVQCSDS